MNDLTKAPIKKVTNNPNTKVIGNAEEIISGILSWMTDPYSSQHCTITGGPGSGKTWLIKNLIATHKSFKELNIGNLRDLIVCGTTHDSLAILKKDLQNENLKTIYSIFGLVPVKGTIHKRDGKIFRNSSYMPKRAQITRAWNNTYICDESNFITQETLTLITKWFPNVHIIFVGSEHQLGTDTGTSVIFKQGWDNFYLNTSHRAYNTEVQAVYDNSEEDVIHKNTPKHIQNSSIVYLNNDVWLATLKAAYTSDKALDCITLAYTNKRVFELVGIIRKAQGKAGYYDLAGPTQALRAGSKLMPKRVKLRKDMNGYVYVPVQTKTGLRYSYVADSYEHYEYLKSKSHKRATNEIYPSLVASMQASTIHGAQGGTWDYTFLDLPSLAYLKHRNPETYRRAKHVAESRHRIKLFVKVD